jgi:hypothetical protein
MLKQTPWMQPPAHGKALDSGQNPKNKASSYTLPQGVVSETRDYTERPFSRPEDFFVNQFLLKFVGSGIK